MLRILLESKSTSRLVPIFSLLTIPLCGLLDYRSGPEISFSIFYLLPIGLAAWVASAPLWGLACLGSAVTWLTADLAGAEAYAHPVIPYWNAIARLGIFLTVAILISNLRRLNRGLEARVAERTANLEQEVTRRRQSEEQVQRQLHRLAALRTIDTAITGSFDLDLTLGVALGQSIAQLNVDAACVLLLNPHTHMLEYRAGRGFRTAAIERSQLRLGEGPAGRAALERRTVHVPHMAPAIKDFVRAELFSGEDLASYCAAPLIAKGEVKGVLEVFRRRQVDVNGEWLGFMEILAGQIAVAVESAQMFSDLQRSSLNLTMAYNATIEGWSKALDLRDKETEGHTQRVTEFTLTLARAMGLSEGEIIHLRRGALLHDIGKMGVPDGILLKPAPLTDEEWVAMKKHPTFAHDLLAPIKYLQPALDIPYCHHEKWDGSGYPRGLKGEQIPLAARIFAVADVYDALTSERPYRKAWTKGKALEQIRSQAGTHFDPRVVKAFFDSDLPGAEKHE